MPEYFSIPGTVYEWRVAARWTGAGGGGVFGVRKFGIRSTSVCDGYTCATADGYTCATVAADRSPHRRERLALHYRRRTFCETSKSNFTATMIVNYKAHGLRRMQHLLKRFLVTARVRILLVFGSPGKPDFPRSGFGHLQNSERQAARRR
ncbi:MAG: hypothetical protein KIS63_05705 [Caldilineales bacterium]|nr:hypothetical protein [Caldilineales bacterium]